MHNISYPQVRQQWFSVGIFPLGQFFGLTGNRPQSAPACSFLRWCHSKEKRQMRIYNLLFYKTYQLSVRSRNFDDIPVLGGLLFVLPCLMFNIFTLFIFLEGIGILDRFIFVKQLKYPFSFSLILGLLWFYSYKGRYKKIINRFENNPSNIIKSLHPLIIIAMYYISSFGLLLLAGLFKNHDWIFKNI